MRKPVGTEAVQDTYCDNCGDYLGVNIYPEEHMNVRECIVKLAERLRALEEQSDAD